MISLRNRCKYYNNGIPTDDDYGIWEIYGESPNCDFGGYHSSPKLGIAKGMFIDVLIYASTMNGFYTWGGGGYIVKRTEENLIEVPCNFANEYLSSKLAEKAKLEEERAELLQKLKENENELRNYSDKIDTII